MEDNSINSNHAPHDNNLDLIYQYSESVLKAVNDDIKTINTKLGIVLGFDGILIKLVTDLPDQTLTIDSYRCYSCLLLKVLIFLLLICSIWVSAAGLVSKPAGSIVRPKELLENWYYEDSENCKLLILKGLSQTVEGLNLNRTRKAEQLATSISFIRITVVLLIIGFLISSLSSSLQV